MILKICIQCLENPSRVRSETIGMRFLKAITILVVVFVVVPGAIGAAVDFENKSVPKTVVILDTKYDSGSNWKIIEPWFEYVESPEMLEEIANDPAYESVTFSDWTDLAPVSKGIWALLHQNFPPEFGLDGPYFSYKQFNSVFRTLHITLYMHGLCNVTILTGSTVLNVIPNRYGENCGNDFRTISVNLDRDEGVNEFNVSLATSPGAFILVDIIEATDVEEIIPTTTETANSTGTDITSPSEPTIPASLETSSATSIETSRDTGTTTAPTSPTISIRSSTEGPTSEYPSSIITSARTVATSDSSPESTEAESTETSPSDLTTESDPTSKTNPSTSRSSDETAPSQNPTSETSGSDPTSDPSTGPETPDTTVLPETPSTTENHSSSLLPNSVLMLLIPITLQGFIISKFQ
ncbi:unnamed protein product [Allacma fusca]|uniref:Uncharacterized protein n=1 Tax=Allacma fusca TaxID=39272 RepID=A0A8J2JH80_9HEXA|nr:unnamed protein product [Allacma fusca]